MICVERFLGNQDFSLLNNDIKTFKWDDRGNWKPEWLLIHGWRRNGKVFFGRCLPFITLIDQHDRDIGDNGILTVAILANKPAFLVEFKQALFFLNAGRAS
jgi:hypothetical protein